MSAPMHVDNKDEQVYRPCELNRELKLSESFVAQFSHSLTLVETLGLCFLSIHISQVSTKPCITLTSQYRWLAMQLGQVGVIWIDFEILNGLKIDVRRTQMFFIITDRMFLVCMYIPNMKFFPSSRSFHKTDFC